MYAWNSDQEKPDPSNGPEIDWEKYTEMIQAAKQFPIL